MSVAEAAHRPANSGRTAALWLGFLLLIAAAVGLAWIGAGSLRPIVTQSGLQFSTIKAGHGDPMGHADAALLDYVLMSDDGNVLDSSESHGGPQPFTMDQVYPGFAEAMRAESLKYTPMGIVSRGVSGIAGRTLIINFPGNPKSISQLFGLIAPTLEHVVATLKREPGTRTHGH